MEIKDLVKSWFKKWDEGDFLNLPIAETFKHTSPFGTINGKKAYLNLVQENKDKFLGHVFKLHDELYENDRGCVRYTSTKGKDFILDVSEWYYVKDNLIEEIIAYYHIGEIRDERKLSDVESEPRK